MSAYRPVVIRDCTVNEDQLRETISTFDQAAERYLRHFQDYPPYQSSYEAFLAALKPAQKRVLELACGPGQVTHHLLQKRPDLEIIGVDLAPNMIRLAKDLNPGVDYRVMDVREVGTLGTSFDAVFAGFCLPYLPLTDVEELLRDLGTMLHPGGLLYLSLTTGADDALIRQTSPNASGAVYLYHHPLPAILQQLQTLGFGLLESATMEHEHHQKTLQDVYLLARLI